MVKINQLLVVLVTHLFTTSVFAQTQNDSTLTNYLNQVQQTYETGSYEELKKLFKYEGQPALIDWIQKYEVSRQQAEVQLIEANQDSATVLMFCKATAPHPVTASSFQSRLSGFYKLIRAKDEEWQIVDKVAIDRSNAIKRHSLSIEVDPGVKMDVSDTLLINVADPLGFWMTLNSNAEVRQVYLGGEEINFTFRSGLLWIKQTDIQNGELFISYVLGSEAFNMPEQIRFAKEYAYLRQNFWHPMLKYGSTKNIADFSINVQIPASYQLTTSFPVTSKVHNGTRYIRSKSTYPAEDLALLYDKEWEVEQREFPPMIFEIFATSDYTPSKDTVFRIMKETTDVLTAKFGSSLSNYFGLAQSRLLNGSSWTAKTNSLFISLENGGEPIKKDPKPGAVVAHEISHGWTNPTGPARLFLMEGWATFVETYFLQKAYGDSAVHAFWQHQKNWYTDYLDNETSLWEDNTNSGVSYSKGSWVLKILRDRLGEKTFEAGFKNYIQNTITQDKDIYAFSESMSAAAGYDLWPMLETWLKSRHIPEVKAMIQDGHLVIEQTGDDVFQFPLEVALKTKGGVRTQTYTIQERKTQYSIDNPEEVTDVQVDPNDEMLLTVVE